MLLKLAVSPVSTVWLLIQEIYLQFLDINSDRLLDSIELQGRVFPLFRMHTARTLQKDALHLPLCCVLQGHTFRVPILKYFTSTVLSSQIVSYQFYVQLKIPPRMNQNQEVDVLQSSL